ncbi:type II secretion system GspH family protein [Shewanella sp. 1CM18E]|uniref:type II secretion system protein n=1 Tax=Shewanella sp. 1CM18E TaxID=2929169 RepID=UPI0020BDF7F0|nr:type II secretion system protein [Shewanella sp. 1CM18E]MCK8046439.1 type II secretion system GspH family protein [Shewanella sp. 1CM18E]
MLIKNKSTCGYTLIELVTVVVILAIIAVFTLPKLLDIGQNAQIAQLQDVAAKVDAQNKIIYTKTAIESINELSGCSLFNKHPNCNRLFGEYFIDVSGTKVYVSNGYPLAPIKLNNIINNNYRKAFGLSEEDFLITNVYKRSGSAAIVPAKWQDKLGQIRSGKFECHVEYRSPTRRHEYAVTTYTRDC